MQTVWVYCPSEKKNPVTQITVAVATGCQGNFWITCDVHVKQENSNLVEYDCKVENHDLQNAKFVSTLKRVYCYFYLHDQIISFKD